MPMLMSEIIKLSGECEVKNFAEDFAIEAIENDNRKPMDGKLFIAMSGNNYDSHRSLPDIVKKGALALIVEKPVDYDRLKVPVIRVHSSFEFTKKVAAAFYGFPSSRLTLAGITGTNGKTTTSYFLRSVLSQKYMDCGLIGTIKYIAGNQAMEAPNTSPEPLFFQELLSKMVSNGLKSCVMEISSHAIKLGRVENTEYDYLIFTNLSKEHTEFHPTMDDYYETKAAIFKKMFVQKNTKTRKKTAIINADDPYGMRLISELAEISGANVFKYALDATHKADLFADNIRIKAFGASFDLRYKRFGVPIELKMTGLFNVYNALAAAACGICDGMSLNEIKSGLEYMSSVPGRFQLVDCLEAGLRAPGFSVFVDYAHTPEGITNVLGLARSLNPARVITVMGCGGDRSHEKRPMMGYNAAINSELTIITSDNPRTEDPDQIIKEVMTGVLKSERRYLVEPDRAKAIGRAIDEGAENDIIIIAGKGHENYQIIGNKKIDFDDYAVALAAIKKRCVSSK